MSLRGWRGWICRVGQGRDGRGATVLFVFGLHKCMGRWKEHELRGTQLQKAETCRDMPFRFPPLVPATAQGRSCLLVA